MVTRSLAPFGRARAPAGRDSVSEHSVNIQGGFGERSVLLSGGFGEHSVNIQFSFREGLRAGGKGLCQ
jgi:hypothetical protein